MAYDFDQIIERRQTNCVKWDRAEEFFGLKDILPMWVADMDFRAPQPIVDALGDVVRHGIFGYACVPDSYYEAVTRWMERRHSWPIKRDWVVTTPGVVPALHMLVKSFSVPGDQVIVQTPVYYPFFSAITRNDRQILDNPLRLQDGFYVMDLADLERKVTPQTKMLLLCSPHNPVGRVWSEGELRAIGEFCLSRNILVVSDEVHHDIVYPGHRHVPFASISSQFADHSVTCTGASKSFNLAGLQMSNIIIPNPSLADQFTATVRSSGINLPGIFGVAATEAAYRHCEPWLEELIRYLKGNLDLLNLYTDERIPGLKVVQPQGTYLVWLDFRGCGIPESALADFVRQEARIGLEAGTIFGAKEAGFERMNIACPRSILAEALSRIEQALSAISKP